MREITSRPCSHCAGHDTTTESSISITRTSRAILDKPKNRVKPYPEVYPSSVRIIRHDFWKEPQLSRLRPFVSAQPRSPQRPCSELTQPWQSPIYPQPAQLPSFASYYLGTFQLSSLFWGNVGQSMTHKRLIKGTKRAQTRKFLTSA